MARKRSRDDASSSSRPLPYHVFLNFRGGDTRKTFTDHLYSALVGAGLRTFRDDDDLDRGEDIKSGLEAAIASSTSSIIVFSKHYASSSWCLDELVLILQCKKTCGLIVFPVFYDVDPCCVRRQTGCVGEAFVRHEERFKNEADDKRREYWVNKVKGWRAALTEAANLSGMVLQNEADGHESKFIQKVVSVIEGKVTYNPLDVEPYLVGIDARVCNINGWLRNGSSDVGIVAIYGMGGVGKTTIAKHVFAMNFERFKYKSFLANIREISRQPDGLLRLQRQLLSDILSVKAKKINSIQDGINKIKGAVCRGRVLIILDDVDEMSQLDAIFGMRGWFYPGSKIIITTRNMQFLKGHEPCEMFAVEGMDFKDSLELFSWHAFGDHCPAEGFLEHSKKIIMHCDGLPLALQVLGSSLRGKNVDVWISAIEKLKTIPHCQVQNVLEISYESLQDGHDRDLFLDIACFFIGLKKSYVTKILDECDYYTTVGIENLVDRCLLTIDSDNKLRMHQLIQDMGREIIRKQSPKEPGERSRLWYYKDSFKVLKEETGTETIEGLGLDMSMLTEDQSYMKRLNIYTTNDTRLKTDAFSKMHKLRLLQINKVQLIGEYKDFPKKLRWLCWHGSPLTSLPNQFHLDSLVAIDMQDSNLEKLWSGRKFLGLLKFLNLSRCNRLVKTPDLSKAPALEKLILKDCASLVEVDESIGMAEGLLVLNLRNCSSLKKLPKNIVMLKFLEMLIISGCSNLHTMPIEEMKELESLKVFQADGVPLGLVTSATRESPSWLGSIWKLVARPRMCHELPRISLPRSLVRLSLVDCNLAESAFPKGFCNIVPLKYLDLSRNPIRFLPDCFNGVSLEELTLCECKLLQEVTGISSVENLRVQECPLLEDVKFQSSYLKAYFLPCNCEKLVEFCNGFKLVPIENIEPEIVRSLALHDLELLKGVRIKLRRNYTFTVTEDPIQVVYENNDIRNFCSIFLPGDSVPGWFAYRSSEPSLSFTVPSPQTAKIRCLNICFVYKIDRQHESDSYGHLYIMVHNLSKDKKFVYSPSCYGVPDADKYMIWLSQWKLSSHEMGGRDELIVSPFSIEEPGFDVKEVGAHLVYDDDEQVKLADFQSIGRELTQQDSASSVNEMCAELVPVEDEGSTRIYFAGYSFARSGAKWLTRSSSSNSRFPDIIINKGRSLNQNIMHLPTGNGSYITAPDSIEEFTF